MITTPGCAVNCRYCFRRLFPYQDPQTGSRTSGVCDPFRYKYFRGHFVWRRSTAVGRSGLCRADQRDKRHRPYKAYSSAQQAAHRTASTCHPKLAGNVANQSQFDCIGRALQPRTGARCADQASLRVSAPRRHTLVEPCTIGRRKRRIRPAVRAFPSTLPPNRASCPTTCTCQMQ